MMLLVAGSMSTRILGFGIIATGGVVLAIALIIGLGFPNFVYHENLKSICLLSTKPSNDYDDWVNETFWSNWNRIYYWHLVNKDDFLFHSAAPLFQQRGPYVYFERHSKIDVRFVSTVTQFRVWRQQFYDDSKTKEECGATCSEDDKITVLNLEYFRRIGKYGGDVNLTLSRIAEVLNETLDEITNRLEDSIATWNYSRTLELLGALDSSPVWDLISNTTSALTPESSFGAWLGKNDSAEKAEVLRRRNFRDFNETEMAGLYELLRDTDLLGDTLESSCSIDWTPRDPNNFFDEFRLSRSMTSEVPRPCGFLMLLLRFRQYRDNRHERELLRNVTRMATELLCPDAATSCFELPKYLTHSEVLLSTVYSYVVDQLSKRVFYVEVVLDGEDLVTTRTQRELATGRWRSALQSKSRVDGILEDFEDAESASAGSRIISVYNCYDAVQAATSGLWQAYDGKDMASADQFPKASQQRRRISRSLRYQVAPNVNLTACGSYSLAQPYYSVFLPEFARTVGYKKKDAGLRIVDRLVFDEGNLDVDDEFVFELGLQDMTGVNGYMSWVSLPHYLHGNASLQQQFNMTPSSDQHLPYRDFEPMTGVMWNDVVRYQVSVGLNPDYISLDRPTGSLKVNFTLRPMPVFWTEMSSSYNDIGIEHFYAVIGHYMTVSCGGLVSLSVIASVIMLLGLLAATVTVRDGKVMPIMEDASFY